MAAFRLGRAGTRVSGDARGRVASAPNRLRATPPGSWPVQPDECGGGGAIAPLTPHPFHRREILLPSQTSGSYLRPATRSLSGISALSVILMCSGQTSVQHLVMLQ